VAVSKSVTINLGFDLVVVLSVSLQPSDVNLNIEVTNVTDDSVVGHSLEVLTADDITVTSGGDENLTLGSSLLHGDDLVATDSSLKGVDGVNLSNDDTGTHASKSHGATLTDITETSDDSGLTSNHNVGSTLDTVDQRLTAAVKVVKLGLGNTVIDVDGRDLQLVLSEHLVKVVNTGGGLLTQTEAVLQELGVLLVNKSGQISTIIEDEVKLGIVLESLELLLNAPKVLLLGLTLPGENGNTSSSDSGSSVVLSTVDVTGRPSDLSTESDKSLDENGSLDGHVQAASNAGALQGLNAGVLSAGLHETRHFVLSKFDFLAAEGSKRNIGNFEIVSGGRHRVMKENLLG